MQEIESKECPFCARVNRAENAKCEYCGASLSRGVKTSRPHPSDWMTIALCAATAAIFLAFGVMAKQALTSRAMGSSKSTIAGAHEKARIEEGSESTKDAGPETLQPLSPASVYQVNNLVPKEQAEPPSIRESAADRFLVSRLIDAAKKQDTVTANDLVRQIEIQVKPEAGDTVAAAQLSTAGVTALNNKNYPQAVKMLQLATKKDPSNPELFNDLGRAQTGLGDLTSAEKSLSISLLLAPRRGDTWRDLGVTFAKQGNKDNAVACFILGYNVGDGKSSGYLTTLANSPDEDPNIVDAAKTALTKVSGIASR